MFYPTDEQLQKGFGDDVILVRGSCGAGTLRGWDGSQATDIQPVAFRGQRLIASGPVRTIADAAQECKTSVTVLPCIPITKDWLPAGAPTGP